MNIKYVNLGNERGFSHVAVGNKIMRVEKCVEWMEKKIKDATEVIEQGLNDRIGKSAALERAKDILIQNNN